MVQFPHREYGLSLYGCQLSHISTHCKKMHFTTVKCSQSFGLESGNSKLWIREERLSNPLRWKILRKIWKWAKCESSEHAVSGTGSRKIWFWNLGSLCQQTYCQRFHSFLYVIKCYEIWSVKVGVGRSAFPQYLVYSQLRNICPNYALWMVTTHLNNYAAAKFVKIKMSHKKIRNEPVWLKILRLVTRVL